MMKRIVLLAVVAMLAAIFPMMGAGATGDHPALTPETVEQVALRGQAGLAASY